MEEAQESVEIAIDRMQDAEGYAAWIDAENERLKKEAQRLRRSGTIGWTVGSVSFCIGTPLIIEGVRTDNRIMLWSGVGAVAIPNLAWGLGRLFKAW